MSWVTATCPCPELHIFASFHEPVFLKPTPDSLPRSDIGIDSWRAGVRVCSFSFRCSTFFHDTSSVPWPNRFGLAYLLRTSGKGLSAAAGSSLLGGIAAIGKTSTSEDTTEARSGPATRRTATGGVWCASHAWRQVKSVSTKLVSLVADLGTAAITSLADGAKQERRCFWPDFWPSC